MNYAKEAENTVQVPKEQYEAMVKALKFYAQPETYMAIGFFPDPPCGQFMDDFTDDHGDELCDGFRPGKRAREVLNTLKIDWYDEDPEDEK